MDLTRDFNEAAAGPSSDPLAVDGAAPIDRGPAGAAAESENVEQVAEESDASSSSLEEAEAELAQLEDQRAAPALRDNFKPPPKLEQIVHTEIERQRENRIFALKAYLESSRLALEVTPEQDQGEDLEFDY